MSLHRSLIALLCALAAPLGLPAAALAGTTPPVNTTPWAPAGWLPSYTVIPSGTDAESGYWKTQWKLSVLSAPEDVFIGESIVITVTGQHNISTEAFDNAGNSSGPRAEPVWVDGDAPTDTTDPGLSTWGKLPRTVQVSGSDPDSGVDRVEWQLDGGMVQSGPNFSFVPISADGEHTLLTRAFDAVGNDSEWREHTIRIDSVTPTDTTAAPAGWQTAPLQVHVTGTDEHSDIATVTWRLDDGAITTGAPPVSPIVSADGVHTLDTRVTDLAGNQTGWTSTTIRIDKTAPTNQTPASDGVWTTANYAVLVTAADSVSGLAEVQWRVDAGPWMSGASGLQASIVVPGDHELETRAIDVAGNASVWRLDNVRIDRVAPLNTTAAPPPSAVGSPHQVAVTGTDGVPGAGVASVEWQVDTGAVQSGASGVQATVAGHGPHTLRTRVLDGAGNASVWRKDDIVIDAITGDVTAPTDTTTTASANWRTGPIAVTVSATDAGSGVAELRWRIDGQPLATSPGANPSFTITGDGDHVLETRAIDLAGRDSGWRTQTFHIDTTVPVDTTDVPVGWQRSRTFTLSGTDAASGIDEIEYRISGGALQHGTDGQLVNVGADGSFTISTRAIDEAGHASLTRNAILKVDSADPVVGLACSPASGWSGAAVTCTASANGGLSGLSALTASQDGGTASAVADGGAVVVSADGAHVVRLAATDGAGNTAWTEATVQVDTTAPVNDTPEPPSGWRSTPYTVLVAGSDGNGSGVDTIESLIDGVVASANPVTVTGDGTHLLLTRIVDLVGHFSERTDTIKIDSVDPVLGLACSPASGWSSAVVSCTVSANGGPSGLSSLTASQDGGTASAVADGGAVVVSADGAHVLRLAATDGAGNTGWIEKAVNVDTTLPVDTTVIPTAWQHSRGFTLSGTDAVSGIAEIEYTIDGGAVQHATNNESIDVVADGTFTITHRAIDLAGRASAWTSDTLKVDMVDPENTSGVPASTWRPDALVLPLTGTDDTSGMATMQWRLDGGDIQDGGPAVVDEDGEYTLETRAVDVSGLESAWRSDIVKVDTTAPVNDTPEPPSGWRSTPYTVLVEGSDGNGSGVDTIESLIDGVVASANPVTVTGDGEHELLIRIVDNVGHLSERTDTIKIDSAAPVLGLACSPASGWSSAVVSCTASATGGPSGLSSLTASQDGGADSAIADGGAVVVSSDGAHVVRLAATDGAGNTASTEATVHVDRTVPTATVTCAADSGTAYACQASGADATSGVAALEYRLNGGAWTPVAAGASFAIAKGAVQVRAVDGAGNEALTGAVTLVDRVKIAKPPLLTSSSVAVHLAGHTDSKSLVGAMRATRSPTGAVSVDLRPLAVGRGSFRVEIKIKSGKRSTKVKRTVKVGKGGTLPRIAGSLASATEKCTVTLTVRKRVGHKWRRFATAKAVLAG